ncbi:MAG: DUF4249 domain-containing protein [Flavobacteriaceae bacterium]|nr:DUF4249 domain-containing protein [Flavobacteriaceae bacterium]
MKKTIFILFGILYVLISCEDVIDVDLPTSKPQLVIEAFINWQKDTSGENQSIKLSLTSPFFEEEIPPATGANVTIRTSGGQIFSFIEAGTSGVYVNTSFVPELNLQYQLEIIYNDEVYQGFEILKSVSSIDFIEQEAEGGFLGEDIEIKAYYTDPGNEENYYLYRFLNSSQDELELEVYKDEFINGNQIFAYYSSEDIRQGDEIAIAAYGVSKRFYDYFFLLKQQTDSDNGDPFEVQPATLRGNCINITNPGHFPLGYFRLSQVDSMTYIVE